MFHEGDLQSGIANAMQTQKAVLCFVTDDTEHSNEWESVLREDVINEELLRQAVAIKIEGGSQEAGFLTPICPIDSTPAVVLIKNATIQVNLQSAQTTIDSLRQQLRERFAPPDTTEKAAEAIESTAQGLEGTSATTSSSAGGHASYLDLPSSAGQNRLPSNAYEALREYTEDLKSSGKTSREIFEAQLTVLGRLPIFKDEVRRLSSLNPGTKPELSQTARERLLLRLPAAAIKAQMKTQSSGSSVVTTPRTATPSTGTPPYQPVYPQSQPSQQTTPPASASPAPPPSYESLSESQRSQQAEYRKIQKEREQKARDERERIKAQIKADREERRRREAVQKQNDAAAAAAATSSTMPTSTAKDTNTTNPPNAPPRTPSTVVRVQVRTFDGTPLHTTFKPSSTITADIRPWLDAHPAIQSTKNIPYDFKLILTPLPNRKIEAAEEALPLSDLGIRGSCTFVIAPVGGFVDSYSGAAGGLGLPGAGIVGGLVGGGLNLVSGTVGWLGGGVRSMLGYGGGDGGENANASGSSQREQHQQDQRQHNNTGGQRTARMRTLADQRAENNNGRNQFYNGNTLNFEPNRDEERKND